MARTLATIASIIVVVLSIGSPASACEIVVHGYPRPPLRLEDLSAHHTTVVSGRFLEVRVIETFEPWGEPGGIVWGVTVSLDPLEGADFPQPTTFEVVDNPCGRRFGYPKVGEPFRFLLQREGSGWFAVDYITADDVTRYLAWRSGR